MLREYAREITVSLISLAVLIFISSGMSSHLGEIFYFAGFRSYFRAILIGLILLVTFTAIPQLRGARTIILSLQVFILGYCGAEIVYRLFHPKLSVAFRHSSFAISFLHLDYYFIHRLYQLIPLAVMLVFFFSYPKGTFIHYFRPGDWDAATNFRKRRQDTWKKMVIFFLTVLLVAFILSAIISLFLPTPAKNADILKVPNWWTLLIPMMLYAFTGAFIEESLFRGIFLPVFSRFLGERGNLYQAFLFGGIHFDITRPDISFMKLILFTFLGYIWGRAAKETGGIGCGMVMHFAIILMLELKSNFYS